MGATSTVVRHRHMIESTTAPRRRVECIDCDVVLAEDATEAEEAAIVAQHIVNRPKNWPDGLDWNDTGLWAAVTVLAGSSGRGWSIFPCVGVSRWETQAHAEAHAEKMRAQDRGKIFATVLAWGEDLRAEQPLSEPRIRAALESAGFGLWAAALETEGP